MTILSFAPTSTSAAEAAPTFRLYRAPVVAAPVPARPQQADWLAEQHLADWIPLRLSWRANGSLTTLSLRRVLGVGPGSDAQGRPEAAGLAPGDRIRLVEVRPGGPRGTRMREWFRGCVAQQRVVVQGDPAGEAADAVAYGPELALAGRAVRGQWHARPSTDDDLLDGAFTPAQLVRDATFRSDLPVVFNQAGRPNASPATIAGSDARWRLDEHGEAETAAAAVFEPPARQARGTGAAWEAAFWDAATALRSLLEMLDGCRVVAPASLAALPAALAETPLEETSVEGLSLLEAVAAVLLPVGFGFCLEPWAGPDGRHMLRVFELQGRRDGGRVRRPYMAPVSSPPVGADEPEGRRAEVRRIDFVRDNHRVANDVTVLGSPRRVQVTLTFSASGGALKPAWDTDAHDLAGWAVSDVVDPMQWPVPGHPDNTMGLFERRYAYGAAGRKDCAHVFRSFTWNEDGAFNAVVGQMPDLAEYGAGGSDAFLRRPRPVGPTLLRDTADGKARNFPPIVQLGIEGDDDSWIHVPAVVWTDRAGLTLTMDPLWAWHPFADHYARAAGSIAQTLYELYGHLNYLTLLHNALGGSGPRLALRLVGSVECDRAAAGRAPRHVGASWPLPAEKVVRAGGRFALREVPAGSDPFELDDERHDTRDDSDAARRYAERIRRTLEAEVGHGSILLRRVSRAYAPGDVVDRTEGRRIDLAGGGADAAAPVIVEVDWDFQPPAGTELLLETHVLRARR